MDRNAPKHNKAQQNMSSGSNGVDWVHLDPFNYRFKLDEKWAELVQLIQKFVPWSRVGIGRNERTRSNLLDQKLMFCCVS